MKQLIITFLFIICFNLMKAENLSYVDLGFPSGLKWATCNIGADRPEQVGNYYAWGEVNSKKKYVIKNYKYFKKPLLAGLLSVFKPALMALEYITCYPDSGDISQSQVINLASKDDVAVTIRGEGWKIPTKQDFEELIANSTSEMVSVDGIYCLKLTSTVKDYEDRSVFFPLSDFMNDQCGMSHKSKKNYVEAASGVFCWTSTIKSSQSKDSYAFHSGKYGETSLITSFRFIGMPIRPVCY